MAESVVEFYNIWKTKKEPQKAVSVIFHVYCLKVEKNLHGF